MSLRSVGQWAKGSLVPWLSILLAGVSGGEAAAETEAILQLDTLGHRARINDVLVTGDGKYLVSASDDKTIRVWEWTSDFRRIREKRKILGQIGPGHEGQVYAIALSPDDRTLAVGGYLGKHTGDRAPAEEQEAHWIRLYDFPTGELKQVLKAHTNTINDLHFSADGSYLVSASFLKAGSPDPPVIVWKQEDPEYRFHRAFADHEASVNAVRFVGSGEDMRIVSAGDDGTVRLYALGADSALQIFDRQNAARYLAVSESYIAVSGVDQKIQVLDHRLAPAIERPLFAVNEPTGLDFSPDGSLLLAGTGGNPATGGGPFVSTVYRTGTWGRPIARFREHDNLARAVTFLDNKTAVTAGGDHHEIHFWDVESGEVLGTISGVGRRVWSVGIMGSQIAFGNSWTANRGASRFEKYFDLERLTVGHDPQGFQRISQEHGNLRLAHASGGDDDLKDAVLIVREPDRPDVRITRDNTDGYRHNVFGFAEDGTILSGGSNGFLSAYDARGNKLAELVGHTGEIRGIAVQGDRLVSGGSDQTIRIWNLKNLPRPGEAPESPVPRIHPLATLFVGSDDEWVLWTQSGYNTSSRWGDQNVGYHVNHGPGRAAEYLAFDRFRKKYDRRDIVAATLMLGDERQAIASLAETTGPVAQVAPEQILPPTVEIVAPVDGSTVTQGTVRLQANVASVTNEEIKELIIRHDDRQLPGERGLRPVADTSYDLDLEIELKPGENTLEVIAKTDESKSNPVAVTVIYAPPEVVTSPKPNLYVLSIGVSEYVQESLRLKWADDDAQDIARIFEMQKGLQFDDVQVRSLIDQDATRESVMNGFRWINRSALENDMAVIFIAGHGFNDQWDNYYFLPHEVKLADFEVNGVPWEEFSRLLRQTQARRTLLMVDTCRSGNALGDATGAVSNITEAIKKLDDTDSGIAVLSASTDSQASLENDDWKHGAFTLTLLKGLEDYEADYTKDHMVTFNELNLYISDQVPKLTGKKQRPNANRLGPAGEFLLVCDGQGECEL